MEYVWSPWRMDYIQRPPEKNECCVFCDTLAFKDGPENLVVWRGLGAYVILNRYPYTSGHVMVVPIEHQPDLEKLDSIVRSEMMELVNTSIQVLKYEYQPQGFNMGINIGEAGGAGILGHIHMHVVPRWIGDTNFMSSLGMTRVLPEGLEESYARIKKAWDLFHSSD